MIEYTFTCADEPESNQTYILTEDDIAELHPFIRERVSRSDFVVLTWVIGTEQHKYKLIEYPTSGHVDIDGTRFGIPPAAE
jgi:hypothetical protein